MASWHRGHRIISCLALVKPPSVNLDFELSHFLLRYEDIWFYDGLLQLELLPPSQITFGHPRAPEASNSP